MTVAATVKKQDILYEISLTGKAEQKTTYKRNKLKYNGFHKYY